MSSLAPKPNLLLVDDNPAYRESLGRLLGRDFEVDAAANAEEALIKLVPPPDIVLVDLCLDENDSSNRDGIRVLEVIGRELPHVPVIVVTAHADLETAVECMKRGAVDFLPKRSDQREFRARIERALAHGRMTRRLTELEGDLRLVEPRQLIGRSAAMTHVRRAIQVAAEDGSVTVLITGETGVGKELVARELHSRGRRARGPFTVVLLNAIPETVVEAELFGHEAGAFTDARQRRIGYLERSHGGVLFLDEIGNIDLSIQAKMLRFLEEREVLRLGASRPVRLDVQVVAATNASLDERVARGTFREDLYYRLRVHEIHVPALRERKEDIPELVSHFLQLFRRQGKRVSEVEVDALGMISRHPWPGNVRQLRNAIEAAILKAQMRHADRIGVHDLPREILEGDAGETVETPSVTPGENSREIAPTPGDDLQRAQERTWLEYVERALEQASGRKGEAWRLLGYRDRFGPYRRLMRIRKRHPGLVEEFPRIRAAFPGGLSDQSTGD